MEISEAARQRLVHLVQQRETPRSDDGQDEARLHPRLVAVARTGLLGIALDRPRPDDRVIPLGAGRRLLVDAGLARAIAGFRLDAEGGSLRLQPRHGATAGALSTRRSAPALRPPPRPGRPGSRDELQAEPGLH